MKPEKCVRCGFDVEEAQFVRTDRPMLLVQVTKPVRADYPSGPRVVSGLPFWVCGHCQAPGEQVLEIVKGISAA